MEPMKYRADGAGDAAVLEESQVPITVNRRQRFLNACHCQPVDRPPVWLMRQAGRAFAEYRFPEKENGFLRLVQTPAVGCAVSVSPGPPFWIDAGILLA